MKYPEDTDQERKELSPTYNRSGALESVVFDGTTYVDHIAYNARGQRLLISFGNDIMTRYAYDNKTFRLARIRSEKYSKDNWEYSPNGHLKQDTAYFYDLAGNIISTNDESPNSGVGGSASLEREFSYDPLYRLLTATGRENAPTITPIWDDSYRSDDHTLTTAYTQKYNYDKMGNILRLKHTGNNDFKRIFNPDSGNMPADYGNLNLLNEMKIGGTTYSFQYDANGNLTQENADRFYEWDAADQMRCFFINDGSTITKHAHYLYDAAGNRVKKLVRVDGGNYTSNTYIDGVFERKTDGTDEQNTLHIMDDMSRIALLRLGDAMGDNTPPIKFILEDHLGSSVMELKDDGQDIKKEEYYPFGETSFGSHAFKRYKYNGKERDDESGMYYYGARYYSAWSCRFVTVDPLAAQFTDLSPFQYASNSPIEMIDLDGLEGIASPTIYGNVAVQDNTRVATKEVIPTTAQAKHSSSVRQDQAVLGALNVATGLLVTISGAAVAIGTGASVVGALAGVTVMMAGLTQVAIGMTQLADAAVNEAPKMPPVSGGAELIGFSLSERTGNPWYRAVGAGVDLASTMGAGGPVKGIPVATNVAAIGKELQMYKGMNSLKTIGKESTIGYSSWQTIKGNIDYLQFEPELLKTDNLEVTQYSFTSITEYTVKEGDTLSAIARHTNTSVEQLVQLNDISDPNFIQVGQNIIIERVEVHHNSTK